MMAGTLCCLFRFRTHKSPGNPVLGRRLKPKLSFRFREMKLKLGGGSSPSAAQLREPVTPRPVPVRQNPSLLQPPRRAPTPIGSGDQTSAEGMGKAEPDHPNGYPGKPGQRWREAGMGDQGARRSYLRHPLGRRHLGTDCRVSAESPKTARNSPATRPECWTPGPAPPLVIATPPAITSRV